MFYFFLGNLVVLLEDAKNLGVRVFLRTKNMLFLRYLYTRFMLKIIVIFRFLFYFILFCGYWI